MMPTRGGLPGELVSLPRLTADFLELVRAGNAYEQGFYTSVLRLCGCESPEALFDDLRVSGFFSARPQGMALTTKAHRTLLFSSGALGSSSASVFDELRTIETTLNRYDLVREGMTSRFIKGLLNEPGFQRLYICSPWINLQKDDLGRLAMALDKAKRSLARPPEILVLVQTPKIPEVKKTLELLRGFGAEIVEKNRLHSKLYMREPGPSGGLSLAIVGSENLTRQKWIELGVEIRNDSHILSKLRSYFFDVFGSPIGE
jgi:hypothetical protein